jgi:hypothetical protein
MIEAMPGLQQIHYRDRLAAVVLGGEATIDAQLSGEELLDVQAMCLFAIQTARGEQPGTYTDQRAAAFAAQTRAQRALTRGLAAGGG